MSHGAGAEAKDFWSRAVRTIETARRLVESDPDACASRAYYAAFYAASALFSLEGRTFTRHSAIETAVHRDLVRTGRWPADLGVDYTFLRQLRESGDYGAALHVSVDDAGKAIEAASRVMDAVAPLFSAPGP